MEINEDKVTLIKKIKNKMCLNFLIYLNLFK